MKLRASNSLSCTGWSRWRAAFSLIEVLVVTGLLSVIIIGLVLMFSQTQRAYKLGTTQVDVLEGGRMVTDIVTRDLQQMTPARLPYWTGVTNFSAVVLPPPYVALSQPLAGNLIQRTNVLQDMFFLSRENQNWRGIGYVVRTNHAANGNLNEPVAEMGSLYRFEQTYSDAQFRVAPYGLNLEFLAAIRNSTNATLSKLLDGVVHFVVRTYDPGGRRIEFNHPNVIQTLPTQFRMYSPTNDVHPTFFVTNEVRLLAEITDYSRYGEIGCSFQSNAVPATVEVEIGVLESKEIERARSITDATARANYLSQQAGKVHIFRWRVAIRNFDPAAYQ